MRRVLLGLVALMLSTAASHAVRLDTEVCRRTTEAVMHGKVGAAVDALEPQAKDRAQLQELMERLVGQVAGAFKQQTARLERTLGDIAVEGQPASLQIWSFGDKEIYFIGCHVRLKEGNIQVFLEAHPTVEKVAEQLRAKLQ
jgi:hypothetical protein